MDTKESTACFPVSQVTNLVERELSSEELEILQKDNILVTPFKREKLEREAQRNWDLFYKRNSTNFFKDRHWTQREFAELRTIEPDKQTTLFEVGCGVGNTIFPLLSENTNLFVYACDFSPRAVTFVKEDNAFDTTQCNVFQCDITKDDITKHVPLQSIDVATLFFVMSALEPSTVGSALSSIHKVMKPNGIVLFRDYGLNDHAMIRFKPGHKLSERFYVRQDGTRAYYFSVDETRKLFECSGYEVVDCEYVHRQTVNRGEGLCVPRTFLQGRFTKLVAEEEGEV